MRPASLSATNTSPFGAVRMMRGPDNPEANRLTSKPFGTIGFWSVRCTILTTFRTDLARSGAGKSCGLISRRVPGRSACQSPNAAEPSSRPAPVCASSGMAVSETIAATEIAMIAGNGRRMACSWQSPNNEQAEAGGVPGSMDVALVRRDGKVCGRQRRDSICAVPAGRKSQSESTVGINPAIEVFSPGIPPVLHSIRSTGDAP